jgi:phosphatidylglycerophosphate synthase
MKARRPLKTRQRRWAAAIAGWLTRRRISPNAISLSSVATAALAGICFAAIPGRAAGWQIALLVAAAGLIQLRLLANLLDGMVALEGGLHTPTGDLFNELPDRLADSIILVAAGYAIPLAWGGPLGWLSALLAVLTAYIRLLGGSLGLPQDFGGPMAKPHRMAVLTLACLVSAGEAAVLGYRGRALAVALAVIALGSALTIARRTWGIRRGLLAR